MRIIDLSQPLFNKMPVYPGDPEVVIQEIHSIEKNGWNMMNMTLTTHLGTHVNVPYHMISTGEKLDSFPLDRFIGHTELYQKGLIMKRNKGVLFSSCNIDSKIIEKSLFSGQNLSAYLLDLNLTLHSKNSYLRPELSRLKIW